jgi:hypothetical protein
MPLCSLAYRIFTFAVEENGRRTIKENQILSPEMRFLNMLCNNLERGTGAGTTAVAAAVRTLSDYRYVEGRGWVP